MSQEVERLEMLGAESSYALSWLGEALSGLAPVRGTGLSSGGTVGAHSQHSQNLMRGSIEFPQHAASRL